MHTTEIMTIGQQALWVTMLIGGPLLLAGLVAGLLISILQAATQINEMTLSFIPKILAIALVLMVGGTWMLHELMDFTTRLLHSIPVVLNG